MREKGREGGRENGREEGREEGRKGGSVSIMMMISKAPFANGARPRSNLHTLLD